MTTVTGVGPAGGAKAFITAGMLDENGKAFYGTPGPGSYTASTAFRSQATRENGFVANDDPGKQVFPRAGAYSLTGRTERPEKLFISNMHNATYHGYDSPGPTYNYKDVTLRNGPVGVFSTSDRQRERSARFISKDHCSDSLGLESPGPSAYRLRAGKGVAKSMGDAPTWVMGVRNEPQISDDPSKPIPPGPGAYDAPSELGLKHAPGYTFAPMGDDQLGRMRDRTEQVHLFISEEHNRGGDTISRRLNPGPADYSIPGNDTYMHKQPQWKFNKKERDSRLHPFISKDHVEPDSASPGPVYLYKDDPIRKSAPRPTFAVAERGTLKPELGGNKGGPIISREHQLTYVGANSPGPAHYSPKTGKGHASTLGDCPLYVFGSEARNALAKELEAASAVPGPGAYMIRDNASAASHTMAPALRYDFTEGADPNEPGPGTYDMNDGLADTHPVRKSYGTMKMKKSTTGGLDRSGFITTAPGYNSPGPGSYSNTCRIHDIIDSAPKYSFGMKEKCKGGGKAIATYRYHGPLHAAENIGINSPGPGHYNHKTGKGHAKTMGDSPNMKFGTAERQNCRLFISDAHNRSVGDAKGELPGPGHYDVSNVRTSRNKNRGGCSFGTAPRPFGGNVRF